MSTEKSEVEKKQDAEYDKVWEEEDAKEQNTPVVPEPEKKEDAVVVDDKEKEEKKDVPAPVKDEKEKEASPPAAPVKPLEGVDKALHDTKAYATKLATENANLRKALEGKQSDATIAAAKESQQKAEAELKGKLDEAYKDYPELKGALDSITGELKTVREKLTAREQADEQAKKERDNLQTLREQFDTTVKPEVLKIHPDFDTIASDPKGDFFKWAAQQSPALQAAVFNSMIPSDINWAVGEYKKARSSGDVEKLKASEDAIKENNLNLAHGLKSGSSKIPSASKKENKDDYEEGWDAAGKTLEKQGVK